MVTTLSKSASAPVPHPRRIRPPCLLGKQSHLAKTTLAEWRTLPTLTSREAGLEGRLPFCLGDGLSRLLSLVNPTCGVTTDRAWRPRSSMTATSRTGSPLSGGMHVESMYPVSPMGHQQCWDTADGLHAEGRTKGTALSGNQPASTGQPLRGLNVIAKDTHFSKSPPGK